MKNSGDGALFAPGEQETRKALRALNPLAERHGVSLSDAQIARLIEGQKAALSSAGRILFGEGPLPALAYAFCDSPFICRDDYADTLLALEEAFFYFKNESDDAFADDELIACMKAVFDGAGQGSVEFLTDLTPEELFRLGNDLEKE